MILFTRIHHVVPAMLIASMAALCLAHAPAGAEENKSAVVIMTRDDEPYRSVLAGIRKSLTDAEHDLSVDLHSFQSDPVDARSAVSSARKRGRAPLIAVGSVATQAALDAKGDGPVIACMIVNEQSLKGARNATAVVLEFPVEMQLQWMRRFVPEATSIGVIYNPAENREEIGVANAVAARLGLRLVSRPIDRPQELPDALTSLAREVDLLWGVTDRLVLSPQTAEAILLFSFRNRIPFAGLSTSWVKAGALYALDRDYADLGSQCGEMALEVLHGTPPGSLRPVAPRKVRYSVNLKTAEHMKVDMRPDLIDQAQQVFR